MARAGTFLLALACVNAGGCSGSEDRCGPSTCGSCAPGCVPADRCEEGTWACRCECSSGDAGGEADECTGDGDCPAGACWQFPSGQRRCVAPPEGYVEACEPDDAGCCETDGECTDGAGGRCLSVYVGHCGGELAPPTNYCRYDECQSDGDCTDGYCAPAGVAGFNAACLASVCRFDRDCTQGLRGRCEVTGADCFPFAAQLYCAYGDDPCRLGERCPSGPDGSSQRCVPDDDGHGTRCVPWEPPP
jgi:hypothetical protein